MKLPVVCSYTVPFDSTKRVRKRGEGTRKVDPDRPRRVLMAPCDVLVVEYDGERCQRQYCLKERLTEEQKKVVGIGRDWEHLK